MAPGSGTRCIPVLTDVPIGMWTSALTLDLVGGPAARPAATRLIALGILTAVPTAVTGWADWSTLETRDQRVGVVHAVSNALAVGLFAASWRARRRQAYARGKVLGLAASSALGLGGYLGGHLASDPQGDKPQLAHHADDPNDPTFRQL